MTVIVFLLCCENPYIYENARYLFIYFNEHQYDRKHSEKSFLNFGIFSNHQLKFMIIIFMKNYGAVVKLTRSQTLFVLKLVFSVNIGLFCQHF